MNKLLRYNPEPFEDPATPEGEHDHEVEFAEYEMEEERGGRRTHFLPSRKGRLRGGGRRPVSRLPLLPFIPTAWPIYPISEPLQDVPPGRDAYRAEPPGGEPPEPTTEPADSEPAADTQPGELPWASEAEWESSTVSRRRLRTPSRPALSSDASPRTTTAFDSQAFRQQIVRIANQEFARWGNGAVKETDPRVRRVLQDYWKTGTGNNYSEAQLGNSAFQTDHPWSAAFISWVMKTAGAGNAFRYSSSHSTYTKQAKDNRLANNDNPFKAYRISELAPQVGDIVCKHRAGSGATYDNIQPGMKTHCDIVTAVQPGRLITVGGNVNNSVAQKMPRTDANGFIVDPDYFAVIRISGTGPSTPGITPPKPLPSGPGSAPRSMLT